LFFAFIEGHENRRTDIVFDCCLNISIIRPLPPPPPPGNRKDITEIVEKSLCTDIFLVLLALCNREVSYTVPSRQKVRETLVNYRKQGKCRAKVDKRGQVLYITCEKILSDTADVEMISDLFSTHTKK